MVEEKQDCRIRSIKIDRDACFSCGVMAQRDRDAALQDLEQKSFFKPLDDFHGPYDVQLSIERCRLVFRMQNVKGEDLTILMLSLQPYKRLVKDYYIMVDSYDEAMKGGNLAKIEAIDMGRRGIHNEGAELLKERLMDRITIDDDTARRLFTLICVLYEGKTLQCC